MRRYPALTRLLAALCVLAGAWPSAASALCQLATSGLIFGDYRPFDGGHRDSVGHVHVTCQGAPGESVLFVIRMSAGTSGSFTPRSMVSGGAQLNYNLFTNASRSQTWGDENAGTRAVTDGFRLPATGGPVVRDYPVYGRLFARQHLPPGAYADLIQVTLESCSGDQQCQVASVSLSIR